jgi:hypothetical protein
VPRSVLLNTTVSNRGKSFQGWPPLSYPIPGPNAPTVRHWKALLYGSPSVVCSKQDFVHVPDVPWTRPTRRQRILSSPRRVPCSALFWGSGNVQNPSSTRHAGRNSAKLPGAILVEFSLPLPTIDALSVVVALFCDLFASTSSLSTMLLFSLRFSSASLVSSPKKSLSRRRHHCSCLWVQAPFKSGQPLYWS